MLLAASAVAGQSSQANLTAFGQVATGVYHSCAVLAIADTRVRCWGFSGDGQLGYGNTNTIGDDETPASVGPVDLGAEDTVSALAAGDYHSCAVLTAGSVRCWGFNFEGQLGTGNRNQIGDNEVPGSVATVNLGENRTATAVTAGNRHTCALLNGGDVRCWGLGEVGQLGYGNTAQVISPQLSGPVNFGNGQTAKAISAGGGHTCAILTDNTVRCWGFNTNGQLGYANTNPVLSPVSLGPVNLGEGRTARAITTADTHTCAILDNGAVRCWGLNDVGQLGYGNTILIGDNETPGSVGPVDLGPGRTAVAISAGGNQLFSEGHTCAVLDDGTVRCWGSGVFGKLGYGNLTTIGDNELPSSVPPVDLGAGRSAVAISSGGQHTCARLDDEGVKCWGSGADGRLGLCSLRAVGDDEKPGSVPRVDIGAGGAACPTVPAPPAPVTTPPAPTPVAVDPGPAPAAPSPAAAAANDDQAASAAARRAERARARVWRACRTSVARQQRAQRTRALRRYRAGSRGRTLALRSLARRATRGRARCTTRFGRVPGRVRTLSATPRSGGRLALNFGAVGSDGSKAPAARRYIVKQSLRPMRTARDFRRAPALCRGTCTFDEVREVGDSITLQVTQLRRNTTYYYKVAARDNVSGRIGPSSRSLRVRIR